MVGLADDNARAYREIAAEGHWLSFSRGRRAVRFDVHHTNIWQDRMRDFMQGNLDASAYSRLVAWGGAGTWPCTIR